VPQPFNGFNKNRVVGRGRKAAVSGILRSRALRLSSTFRSQRFEDSLSRHLPSPHSILTEREDLALNRPSSIEALALASFKKPPAG
jgi:hypothetical protein